MKEVFHNGPKGFLTLLVPCMWFILSQRFEDRLTSGSEFSNESTNVL